MPCKDSSSSISIHLSPDERFISFDFAKITCGREITAETGFSRYCVGRTLEEILSLTYPQIRDELALREEEEQFILYLEWDALRAALAQYVGIESDEIDTNRCQITSIDHNDKEIQVALVILPPVELPKIIPCGMVDGNNN